MSRDYKKKGKATGSGRPMGAGILIGLLLGLCIAIGVALYINNGPSPFVDKYQPAPPAPATVAMKGSNANPKASDPKLEFDFYKILPGWEEAVTDRDFKRKASRATKDREIYYLQVAAFPNPADADNLKARLALTGIESKIQTAQLPDGKIWHRVRIGPFSEKNELSNSRDALSRINLDANLIKVRESTR